MTVVWFILAAIVAAVVLAIAWRFLTLRAQGFPVLVRALPNDDGRHWRHGVLIYSGISAKFFKVRSLRPDCDLTLTRLGTEILSRREPTQRESFVLEPGVHVVVISHHGRQWELAVDESGDTALVAWLESAPSARRDRSSAYNNPRPM